MQEKELIEILTSKDNKSTYRSFCEIISLSEKSNEFYPYFDSVIILMENKNSGVRIRTLTFLIINSEWDTDNKTDEIFPLILKHINDTNAIVSRKCIGLMPTLAQNKPYIIPDIINSLYKCNTDIYKESMASLITRDIKASLNKIKKITPSL